MASFITAIALFVGHRIAGSFMSDIENETLGAPARLFGSGAVDIITKYLTVDEKNTMLLPMGGVLLWNRLMLDAGVAAGNFPVRRMVRFHRNVRRKRRRRA